MSLSQVGTGASDDAGGASQTTRSVAKDSGIAADDLVVAPVAYYEDTSNAALSAPSGATFTDHGPAIVFDGSGATETLLHLFSREVDGTEGASFGFSRTNQFYGAAAALTLRGASALSVVSVTAGTPASGVMTIDAPSVTVGATQGIVCVFALSDPSGGYTAEPAGMTLGVSEASEQSSFSRIYFASPSAGASGAKTLSWNTSRSAIGITILVEGANAGGGGATANTTGVAGTGTVGTLSASGAANTALTGVAAVAAAGALSAFVGVTVALTGVGAAGAVGTLAQAHGSTVTLSGVSATGQTSALAPPVHSTIEIVGVSAAAAVGSLSVSADGSANVALTGVQGAAAIGALLASGSAIAALTGASASGQVGALVGSLGISIPPPSRTLRVRSRSRVLRVRRMVRE